jgi:hypothetical protein
VCILQNSLNIQYNRSIYPLFSTSEINYCSEIDSRFENVYNNGENDIFEANYWVDNYNNLP